MRWHCCHAWVKGSRGVLTVYDTCLWHRLGLAKGRLLLLHLRLGWRCWLLGFGQLLVLAARSPQADGKTSDENDCNARSCTNSCFGRRRKPATPRICDLEAHGPDDVDDG